MLEIFRLMDKGEKKISFIIPSLNEEEHVGPLINSIKENMGERLAYEIILVDNGSTDKTVERASGEGVQTFVRPDLTIGGMRNYGVSQASGDIIVFLDADVVLTDEWGKRFQQTLCLLDQSPTTITGSMCSIRSHPSWIEKHWFEPSVVRKKMGYINCAHLIMTKEFFESIGGFREDLQTGEEWELCRRALRHGGEVVSDDNLKAVHMGCPRTLSEFFRRERWHGRAMYRSLSNILTAKPALIIFGQLALLIVCVIASMVMNTFIPLAISLTFFIIVFMGAAAHRCGIFTRNFLFCAFLYGSYFIARAVSLWDVISELISDKSWSHRRWRKNMSKG